MSDVALWFIGTAVAVLVVIACRKKIKEIWYMLCSCIAEKWYYSKAHRYFLKHEAGIYFFSGTAISVGFLVVLWATDPVVNRATIIRILACTAGMFFGAVIAFIGLYIKVSQKKG